MNNRVPGNDTGKKTTKYSVDNLDRQVAHYGKQHRCRTKNTLR